MTYPVGTHVRTRCAVTFTDRPGLNPAWPRCGGYVTIPAGTRGVVTEDGQGWQTRTVHLEGCVGVVTAFGVYDLTTP